VHKLVFFEVAKLFLFVRLDHHRQELTLSDALLQFGDGSEARAMLDSAFYQYLSLQS
jgi:hypothetical protein